MSKDSPDYQPSLEFRKAAINLWIMSINTVSAENLPNILKQGHLVIDVRTPAEFRAEHVSGANLHPLDDLNPGALKTESEADPIYILCQSGKRATIAAQKLAEAGRKNVFVVEGGTNAAKEAGLDLEHGKGVIPIERQVRIAAGALVAAGSIAGLLIHASFFAVPIFIGCGLVFAGITDTCGMALMLSKMPWNR